MDSPTELFHGSPPQIQAFAPHSSSDLPGVHPPPGTGRPTPPFRPPGFPLIHHLLQSGGAARKMGGHFSTNFNSHRHLKEEKDGSGEGGMEGEDGWFTIKMRHGNDALMAEWSQDVYKGKRRKMRSHVGDGETAEGGRRRKGVKGGKRSEREELKEQLEEARERLQALQEKVWRAFGEKHLEEEKRKHHNKGGEGGVDVGIMNEEDTRTGMYEDELDGVEMEKETSSLLSVSPFDGFHRLRKERQKYREGREERGGWGRLHPEDVMEGDGLWLAGGEAVRGDNLGTEDEDDEGGQKFAQALKEELGSAVGRVIDRVLLLYSETEEVTPSPPPASISFLPSDTEHNSDREKGVWVGLLTRGRGEEKMKGEEQKTGGQEGEREQHLHKLTKESSLPPAAPHRVEAPELTAPLVAPRSPDLQKARPVLGPPLSAHLNPSHPNLPLHHHPLPHSPSLSHPPLLPPASQPKDPSSSFHPSSSSSSSFPAPPPLPLPLPFLHYSMQQLFSRSLHHPQLPHLPLPHKDYLNSDPFLEFSPHPSFPPLPLLDHLDPSLGRHAHGSRERERGMRDGGMRGGMDGGELYLTAGGISFCQKRGRNGGGLFVCLQVDVCLLDLLFTPRRVCLLVT